MKKQATILIVDDDEDVLTTARMILRSQYTTVLTESSPIKLESLLKATPVDVVLLDMNFKTGATSGNEGLFWLRQIKALNEDIQVIMNTAYGDISLAVECMKEGAADFMVKPWEKEKLITTVANVYKLRESQKQISSLKAQRQALNSDIERDLGEMIGSSPAIISVFDIIRQVAETDANVLILGENGTGKELAARAIHRLSSRRQEAFVKADLGAVADTLFESELFGHKKGAFTDAREDRTGRFALAHKGTIFLDEIGNIAPAQQAKLLSVLQNREVLPVGADQSVPIDIRLISATNRTLAELNDPQHFRQDLLYRINTIEIVMPPLRQRKEDILLLAKHYTQHYAQKYKKGDLAIEADVYTKLGAYEWPGNIRELQHMVERAVIMTKTDKLEAGLFPLKPSTKPSAVAFDSLNVSDIEKSAIENAIDKSGGNLTKAAQELGMGRSTLYRKMEKYGIEPS